MNRSRSSDSTDTSSITCILSDVDGVMTDGRIIYDSDGAEIKHFHVRDGLGIKLWMRAGFDFGILTSRTSDVVTRRADELGIINVRQGATEKLSVAEEMFAAIGCGADQVCYIGDDLPDLPVMQRVALSACPRDAAQDLLEQADWVLGCKGGEGVVRELIERLLRSNQRWGDHVPG